MQNTNDSSLPPVKWDKEALTKRAAMYVRMSTDHQKYSTENQAQAIYEYAEKKGLSIVRTYEDAGKSGLKITGRDALQKLISDVQLNNCDFLTILVLDVTRWGRFQDADESAYYEYICRRAGIDVQYVAEQFENDGSPVSTIVKGVKRAMAGEYSRELSCKVFAGQCRLIELGFRQGGPAGFGLRRALVDEHGNHKGMLRAGEHKSFQTDRVILVPGPPEEVEVVRWIYKSFIEDGMQELDIAKQLNARGILTDLRRSWSRGSVHQILINEKYIGNNVFNRKSFKLKLRHVSNPPEMWIRAENAFASIVDMEQYFITQGIIKARSRLVSNDELIAKLKALLERQGWLSGILINEDPDMPSSAVYSNRFGGLSAAYKLIGYDTGRDDSYLEINKFLRALHPQIVDDTINKIIDVGGNVKQGQSNNLLVVNDEFTVSMIIARSKAIDSGSLRWSLRFDRASCPDITVAVRMDETNKVAMDYYFFPSIDLAVPRIRLAKSNQAALDVFRFDDLMSFISLARRIKMTEVL